MDKFAILDQLTEQGLGYLKTADAIAAGVSKTHLGHFVRKRGLERVALGLYRSHDAWDDGMFVLQTRYPQAVFSHETALLLLGFTDREPSNLSVTIRAGSSSSALVKDGIRAHKVKPELLDLGLVEAQTPFGHTVRSYNAERTVCDIVRSRSAIDTQVFQDAMKSYLRFEARDIPRLMRYAKKFSVDKVLMKYLEVLL